MYDRFKSFFMGKYPSFTVHFHNRTYSFLVKSSPWLGLMGTVYKHHMPVFNFVSDTFALNGSSLTRYVHQWGVVRWTYRRIKEKDLG